LKEYLADKKFGTDKDLYPVDSAYVAFINGSPNASFDTLIVKGTGIDTFAFKKSLKMGDGAAYMKFAAGTDTLYFISTSDTLDSGSRTLIMKEFNFVSQGRYTSVIYDAIQSLKIKVYQDD